MKILIVDQIEVALLFQESLERQGHSAVIAGSGDEALALLAQFPADAVFLELRLPGADGVEVLRRIRSLYPDLPVIVITGSAIRQELETARRLGVADIVEKPGMVKELRVILKRLKNVGRTVKARGLHRSSGD